LIWQQRRLTYESTYYAPHLRDNTPLRRRLCAANRGVSLYMCADGLTPTRFVGGIVYPTIFHKIHVTTEDWRLVLSDSLQSLARGTLRFCTLGFCFCFTYLYKPLHLHHALRALQDWRERDARLIFRPPSSMPPPYSGASHPLRSRNRTGMLNTVIPCTLICGVLILAWIAVHSTSALLAFDQQPRHVFVNVGELL
jgi:hypothetical protein